MKTLIIFLLILINHVSFSACSQNAKVIKHKSWISHGEDKKINVVEGHLVENDCKCQDVLPKKVTLKNQNNKPKECKIG